jgi:phage baseplate assembly protein W
MNLQGSAIDFPFRTDARGTCRTTADRREIVAQAIADLIETRRGERVMLPDYGIDDFVFAVQDATFAVRLADHLETQIRRYVPLVKSVTVEAATDEHQRAIVNIRYTEVGEVNAPQNLVYPVWRLQEGEA